MEKKTKLIIGIVSTIVVGTVGIAVYNRQKNKEDESVIDDVVTVISNPFVSNCDKSASFPLKNGSKGKQVKEFQKFINMFSGKGKIDEDCIYGNQTKGALTAFIRNNNIRITDASEGVSYYVYNMIVLPSLKTGRLWSSGSTNLDSWGLD
jgi:hypothetical protein